jgi:hypothetical protein
MRFMNSNIAAQTFQYRDMQPSPSTGLIRKSLYTYLYRVSQEEYARLREGVPYVKVCRYNPKHLCPKLNFYFILLGQINIAHLHCQTVLNVMCVDYFDLF